MYISSLFFKEYYYPKFRFQFLFIHFFFKIYSRLFDIYEEELCNMLDQEAGSAIFAPCYPLVPFNLALHRDIKKLKNSFL